MRHLMTQYADILGSKGEGIVNRIDSAIDFTKALLAVHPLFGCANSSVTEWMGGVSEKNVHISPMNISIVIGIQCTSPT